MTDTHSVWTSRHIRRFTCYSAVSPPTGFRIDNVILCNLPGLDRQNHKAWERFSYLYIYIYIYSLTQSLPDSITLTQPLPDSLHSLNHHHTLVQSLPDSLTFTPRLPRTLTPCLPRTQSLPDSSIIRPSVTPLFHNFLALTQFLLTSSHSLLYRLIHSLLHTHLHYYWLSPSNCTHHFPHSCLFLILTKIKGN